MGRSEGLLMRGRDAISLNNFLRFLGEALTGTRYSSIQPPSNTCYDQLNLKRSLENYKI